MSEFAFTNSPTFATESNLTFTSPIEVNIACSSSLDGLFSNKTKSTLVVLSDLYFFGDFFMKSIISASVTFTWSSLIVEKPTVTKSKSTLSFSNLY